MTNIFTTPIFYANGEPHLGHAYSGILADIFHRYSLLANSESCLITGTDEHGLKIAQAASKSCTEVEDFVDRKSASFAELWSALKIDPNVFIRTTDRFHAQFVEKVWKNCVIRVISILETIRGSTALVVSNFIINVT